MSAVIVFVGTVLEKKTGSYDGKISRVATVGWFDLEAGQAGSRPFYFDDESEYEKFPPKGANVRVFCSADEKKKEGTYRAGKIQKIEDLSGGAGAGAPRRAG